MLLPHLFRFKAVPPVTEESTLSAMKALTDRLHGVDLGEVSGIHRIQPGAGPRLMRLRPASAGPRTLSRSWE
jgi:hypothetical protein